MEPREIHEQMMKLLREVSEAEMPQDSKMVIQGYMVKSIRELHKVVLEKIQEEEIENTYEP